MASPVHPVPTPDPSSTSGSQWIGWAVSFLIGLFSMLTAWFRSRRAERLERDAHKPVHQTGLLEELIELETQRDALKGELTRLDEKIRDRRSRILEAAVDHHAGGPQT